MSNSTINIGSRVFNSEYGWGYVRERNGDMLGIEFDGGTVNLFPSAVTKETFMQYLLNRPGKVGAWSKLEYIVVQTALLCVLIAGILTRDQWGLHVTLPLFTIIQTVIHIGHYRNWQGKQM